VRDVEPNILQDGFVAIRGGYSPPRSSSAQCEMQVAMSEENNQVDGRKRESTSEVSQEPTIQHSTPSPTRKRSRHGYTQIADLTGLDSARATQETRNSVESLQFPTSSDETSDLRQELELLRQERQSFLRQIQELKQERQSRQERQSPSQELQALRKEPQPVLGGPIGAQATTAAGSSPMRSELADVIKQEPEPELELPEFGDAIIGRRVSVFWGGDKKHYEGRVAAFHPKPPDFLVLYDDSEFLWGHTPEDLQVVDDSDAAQYFELAITGDVTHLKGKG
jgi:hypothetical protein